MKMLLFFLRTHWLGCSAIILAVITILSLWPLKTLPPVPGGDKLHHFLAYAALAFPIALRRPNRWMPIMALFIVYSGGIELIQPLAHRYAEWLDLAANTAGIFCGILLSEPVRWWERKKQEKQRLYR
ncbi:MAG: VanZ family protein [Candidatus Electrothrix sp. AUS1_2]|nr:VanZ family protein [Candidatus Electrothrix sp. AUS1_2]